MPIKGLEFRQVDVFAEGPLAGNGLAVIVTKRQLKANLMQALTLELRQFETIFLTPSSKPDTFSARVFTTEEELPFAGHPAIGAAAVLHERAGGDSHEWRLRLPAGSFQLSSRGEDSCYRVTMNQGLPNFITTIPTEDQLSWLSCLGLQARDVDPRLPMSVVSTGLPYLIVPVTREGLAKARIAVDDLETRLTKIGARFAYVFDVAHREGRTWDNSGAVEDIATGSAAGPVGGLLVRSGLAQVGEKISLRQGYFVGRPSEMMVEVSPGTGNELGDVMLTGSVVTVARGRFDDHVWA